MPQKNAESPIDWPNAGCMIGLSPKFKFRTLMAYSHTRFRKTLAVVRVLTGLVFIWIGSFKISSLEFAKVVFPQFLENGIKSNAAEWVRPLLEWIVSSGPGRIGVSIGFLELFIGIALVLGLAVRPAVLLGMIYSAFLLFATWNDSGTAPSMLQSAEHQYRNLFPFLVLLLLGVGHAGETWGAGALYHRGRKLMLERDADQTGLRILRTELEFK